MPSTKSETSVTEPTMFPADDTLIARGKHATLRKERREQLERVRSICTTLITEAQATLRDCEKVPPIDPHHLETIGKCLDNLKGARERLITLGLGITEIQPDAWG